MKRMMSYMLLATAAVVATPATAAELIVDVAGAQSFGALGDPDNTVRTFNIGANARVTAVTYNVNITAFDPSWLSESGVAFTDSDVFDGVLLRPGFEDANPGTGDYFDVLDLVAEGLDFTVGADGVLRLEWYEGFADGADPDGLWNSGTLTFTYEPTDVEAPIPEPATWAMMIGGFGMMGASLRRRRSTSVRFAA